MSVCWCYITYLIPFIQFKNVFAPHCCFTVVRSLLFLTREWIGLLMPRLDLEKAWPCPWPRGCLALASNILSSNPFLVVCLSVCSHRLWCLQVADDGGRLVRYRQVIFLWARIVWWRHGHLGRRKPGDVVPSKLTVIIRRHSQSSNPCILLLTIKCALT